jgi:tetratricopeptide (TPR) repeat protein
MNAAPENPFVKDTLGWVYYKKGLYPKAVNLFKEAIEKFNKEPRIYHHLGLAYLKQGDKEKAKEAFQAALNLGTDFPEKEDLEEALKEL